MKIVSRIFLVIFAVLGITFQIKAQSIDDTVAVVQDTAVITKLVDDKSAPDQTRHVIQPEKNANKESKKSDKQGWGIFSHRSKETDDCEQCENELKKANENNLGLQKQLDGLMHELGNAKAVYDIDDRDFYRVLITTPLERKYDSSLVESYKKTVALFDFENKEEMKWVYEVYYPLLENYGQYNNDIAILIERVVKSFEKLAQFGNTPDKEIEKKLFVQDLEESEYFKKYRYMGVSSKKKDNPSRKIDYLENVINDTKMLFEDPSLFTKENFEDQMKKLKK